MYLVFQCDKCKKRFHNVLQADQHMKEEHPVPITPQAATLRYFTERKRKIMSDMAALQGALNGKQRDLDEVNELIAAAEKEAENAPRRP